MRDKSIKTKKKSKGRTIHMLKDSFKMVYKKWNRYPEPEINLYDEEFNTHFMGPKSEQDLHGAKFANDWSKWVKLNGKEDSESDYDIPLKKASSQFNRLAMNSAASSVFKRSSDNKQP